MKVPISKQLTNYLIIPCLAITGVGLYGLFAAGLKQLNQNIALILFFGIPGVLFTWFLLDKNVQFAKSKKVRRARRFFKLPFSSTLAFFFFIISSLFLVAGLAMVTGNKDSAGLPMLLVSLLAIIVTLVCVEHPKIGFSDSFNADDLIEEFKNIPQKDFPAFQDGIFSYKNDSFTIQLKNENPHILWDDITLIKAYKIDQYTVDCIIIEIYLKATVISVNDQTAGYMKFMEIASEKLYNFKKDWFMKVTFPAFQTNLTIVYEKV